MSEHTPAPWPETTEHDGYCYGQDEPDPDHLFVKLTAADYTHARECVNAMEGIRSPAAWVAEMMALLGRIHEAAPLVSLGEDVVTGLAKRVRESKKE